ncbi:hypothetical protein KKA24_02045 [Patescibacteria group bacterium]|nr:hypothetical protein [Patescibacteria group bacterium]
MPINFKEEKKKQKYLIGIVFLVILITVSILWFGVLKKENPSTIINIKPVNFIKEIDVDFDALDDPIFDGLKIFEEIPKFEGEVGRENPFLPY